MPTGPNCDMTWDQCIAWAQSQEGIDDPEAYCGAREQECANAEARLMSKVRKFWRFQNQADNPSVGELFLYGFIGKDDGLGWLFDEISPKSFKEDLDALGAIQELRVFINSEGGDVFAAQAIHSILSRHEARISVFIDGLAASSASIVAMAGDTITMPRNAIMMVHNPWTFGIGDSAEFRKLAETLDQVRESIIAAYEDKTGLPHDRLIDLLEAETWMTAQEAVDLGFADEISQAREIAASLIGPNVLMMNGRSFQLDRFQNPPSIKTVTDTFANQAQDAISTVLAFERRTQARIASRRNVRRSPSDIDMAYWRDIRDAVERVLADSSDSADEEAIAAAHAAFILAR